MQPHSWTAAFERVCAESDPAKLHTLITEFEDAIVMRSLELSHDKGALDDQAELAAMREAANVLLRIKTEKLGWRDLQR